MQTNAVYALIEIHTGRVYVGSSSQIYRRLGRHVRDLQSRNHHSLHMQQMWNEGGQFSTEIYRLATREEAYALEQALITWFITHEPELLLNVGMSVIGGDNLTRNPKRDEILHRILEGSRAYVASLSTIERKARYGASGELNGMYGRTHSDEVRARLSAVNLGNQYALGSVRSIEHRQLLSEQAKLRVGELNPFYGKRHSEETRQRISTAKKAAPSALPSNTRRICVDGVRYVSLTEAGRQLGISPALMVHRLKSDSPKYANYNYVD